MLLFFIGASVWTLLIYGAGRASARKDLADHPLGVPRARTP
jgi:hypothetical protein